MKKKSEDVQRSVSGLIEALKKVKGQARVNFLLIVGNPVEDEYGERELVQTYHLHFVFTIMPFRWFDHGRDELSNFK